MDYVVVHCYVFLYNFSLISDCILALFFCTPCELSVSSKYVTFI